MKESPTSQDSAARAPRARRRPAAPLAVIGIAGIMLALGLGLWAARYAVIEALIRHQASRFGASQPHFEVVHFDFHRLHLRSLSLGVQADVSVDEIDVLYEPSLLWRGTLQSIEIHGLTLRGTLDDDGLHLASLDAMRKTPGAAASPPNPVPQRPKKRPAFIVQVEQYLSTLPLRQLAVRDARLELLTSAGPVDIEVDGELDLVGDQLLDVQLSAGARELSATARFNAHRNRDSIEGHFATNTEFWDLATPDYRIQDFEAQFSWNWRLIEDRLELEAERCFDVKLKSAELASGFTLESPIAMCIEVSEDVVVHGRRQHAANTAARGNSDSDPFHSEGSLIEGPPVLEGKFTIASVPFFAAVESPDSRLRIIGDTPQIELALAGRGDNPLALQLSSRAGRLAIPFYELEVTGLEFAAVLDLERFVPSVEFAFRTVVLGGSDLSLPTLTLAGEIALLEGQVASNVAGYESEAVIEFEAVVSDTEHIVEIEFSGTHRIVPGSGEATFAMRPLELSSEGAQLANLVPDFADAVVFTKGHVELAGTTRWSAVEELDALANLTLVDLHGTSEQYSFAGLSGEIQGVGPFPPSTLPNQRISVDSVDMGSQLRDGSISFQLLPDSRIVIEASDWAFAKGRVRAAGDYDPTKQSGQFTIELEAIDVAELIALTEMEGLEGTGKLAGSIPIAMNEGAVEVLPTSLRALLVDGYGGWIYYRPLSADALAQTDDRMNIVYRALENFHYTDLEVDVAGDVFGDITLGIHLQGANPAYQSGQQVDFNLKIASQFSDMIRGATAAYAVPEKISQILSRRVAETQEAR